MFRKFLFANFKLVYRTSQWMRQRFTANGMLILLIMPVAGVFGFNTRSTLSFQIFSTTLILLIVAISYTLFFRGRFSVNRQLPDYGTVGAPLSYSCLIKNHNNKAKKELVLIDELHSQFPTADTFKKSHDPLDKKRNRIDRFIGYPRLVNIMQRLRGGLIPAVSIDYIAEKSAARTIIEFTPLRRGYLYFNRLRLVQADPLGLFNAQKSFTKKDKLLVLPKLYNAPKLNLRGKRTYQHGGVNNAASVGDSQEFISLRDYRPGDPIKSIHWRSYAKINKPIVKEYQDEFFIRNGLILDTWLGDQDDEIFEDAVSIAASFLSIQQQQDALLDLMFIGNNAYRFTSGRGLLGIAEILEILACVEPAKQANINQLESLIQTHSRECSALICIMLALDDSRRQLLSKFQAFNIPIKVLLVTNDDNRETIEKMGLIDIHTIRHNKLQADLDTLGQM